MKTPSYISRGFHWLCWDERTKRMEIQGHFTAKDLRNIAEWMDSSIKCFKPEPIMDIELDPIQLPKHK